MNNSKIVNYSVYNDSAGYYCLASIIRVQNWIVRRAIQGTNTIEHIQRFYL
jgi:hypothetical protein